jgi:hypothetical protein
MVRCALLLLLLLAPLAQAQTYKWVDERGVVNYSNTPPPAATKAQPVEDRISVYASEPTIAHSVSVEQRLAALEAEWLQRQRLMAYAAATPPAPPAYDDTRIGSYYGPYIVPTVAPRRPRLHHVSITPRVRSARASVSLDSRR